MMWHNRPGLWFRKSRASESRGYIRGLDPSLVIALPGPQQRFAKTNG